MALDNHLTRVAIITRTKDRPFVLGRAIESVLGQSFSDWVHVIVNDGGNPATVDAIVGEYKHRYKDRLRIIHNPQSIGMQEAANKGIRATDSEYVTIHDDDDSWRGHFLMECVTVLDELGPHHTSQGIATQTYRICEEIASNGEITELRKEEYYPFKSAGLFRLASDNLFPPIAFLYRRKVHDKIGYFNQKFNVLGDWDFNLRFLSEYDIAVSSRFLANYHWRMAQAPNGYGNTVTHGVDEHHEKLVELQNHYLRADLKEGKMGLGYLLCSSKMFHGLSSMAWENKAVSRDIQNKLVPKTVQSYLKDIQWWFGNIFNKFSSALPKPSRKIEVERKAEFNEICAKMGNAKVLSIDVFDTALLRKLNKATDIFLAMTSQAEKIIGADSIQYADVRIRSERTAREVKLADAGTDEVSLAEIYQQLGKSLKIDQKKIDQLMDLELQTEKQYLYANPVILRLCDHALKLGLKVTYISDMYLSSGIIGEFLAKNGFPQGDIFVSCELGQSKHHGNLWKKVLDRLQVEPEKMIHLGDNHHSDYLSPLRHRVIAIHVQHLNPKSLADDKGSVAVGDELGSSISVGLARWFVAQQSSGSECRQSPEQGFWSNFGYQVVGPIYFLFLHWLIVRATAAKAERLFFFSRDGYALLKGFDILKSKWGLAIQGTYLYASRRLYNFARIERLDREALDFLLSPNPGLRTRDFLERCGFSAENYEEYVAKAKLPELDKVLTSFDGQFIDLKYKTQFETFLKSVEKEFLSRCSEERERLFSYLDASEFSLQRAAVVDVGWRASLCASLQELMNRRGSQGSLQAFLFGTWEYAINAIDKSCVLESFFFHLDKPQFRKDLIAECVELAELMFSAPHATIIGLQGESSSLKTIYGEPDHNSVQSEQLEEMRNAALRFVDDASNLIREPDAMQVSTAYVEAILERILRRPTADEGRILGCFQHRDGFGDKGGKRFLANPSVPTAFGKQADLRHLYNNSYWKAGFRAQLNERQKRSLKLG